MKNFFKKIKKKHYLLIGVFLLLFIFSFLIVSPVEASRAGSWVTTFFGWIFSAIVYMLGLFLILLVRVLIYIAQFNNFIGVEAVSLGWSMVRDLANMFFVVILLIIAFATILRIEKYNYKKWLPKLILMAILINFSKIICGLLIDVAQVIMLSFVNAIKNIAGLNVTHMLGIRDWSRMHGAGEISGWEVMGAYFLAVIYVIVSIVVIGTMLMILVMRIIMIWIYVILSPIAFLMQSFPDGQGYASKWWQQFTQNLVVGPVLAFFIWLSFSVVSVDVSGTQVLGDDDGFDGTLSDAGVETVEEGADHGFASGDLLIQFIVSIGLLVGGLQVAQQIGGAAGSIAGKGVAKLKNMSLAAQKGAIGAGKSTAKWAGRKSLEGASNLAVATGKEGGRLEKLGKIGQAWTTDIKSSRKKAKIERREKFLKSMGMGEKAGDAISRDLKDSGLHKKYSTMYEATHKMGEKPKRTRKFVESLSDEKNPMNPKDTSKSDWHTMSGGVNKGNVEGVLGNADAMKNIQDWLNNDGKYKESGGYTGNENDLSIAKSILLGLKDGKEKEIKGIDSAGANNLKDILENNLKVETAVAEKSVSSSGAVSPEMSEFYKELLSKISKIGGGGEKGAGQDSGIRYDRSPVGQSNNLEGNIESANINQGKLFTNTFASGDKEALGIDFNQLKTEGVDIDSNARGANLNSERMGDNLKPIVDALINQLNQAQINLDKRKKSGEISESEYKEEMKNISGARGRLKSGDFENINLVNTGKEDFSREMALRNIYHEEVHASGLDDEDLTKEISNSLMSNKLYGRNPETGNRHAFEIGQLAQDLKSIGVSDQDVVKRVDEEIKKRSQNEASSRAERVMKLERGEIETESQAVVNVKKEKKKGSMVDVARERGLIKKQMDFYRKMITDGSKKDENGKYDENKVKIGEDGIRKMQELTKALNKLESINKNHSDSKEKIKDYRDRISQAEKEGDEGSVLKFEEALKSIENEKNKIDLNSANKEYIKEKEILVEDKEKKADIADYSKPKKSISKEEMHQANLKELDGISLDKKLKETISRSVIDNNLFGKKDEKTGESYLIKTAKEVDSKKQRAKISESRPYSNKNAVKDIQTKLKLEGQKPRNEFNKEGFDISYNSDQLEESLNNFSEKIKQDLSGIDSKEGKSKLVVKKEGGAINQSSLLSGVRRAFAAGNDGVVKMINNYNKTNSLVTKKLIIKELSDKIDEQK